MSSLHGAKGHEFGSVFVVGAVEGIIPLQSAVEAQNIASEAAVLYVGMTRARDLLYLSHSTKDRNGKSQKRSSFVRTRRQWCDYAELALALQVGYYSRAGSDAVLGSARDVLKSSDALCRAFSCGLLLRVGTTFNSGGRGRAFDGLDNSPLSFICVSHCCTSSSKIIERAAFQLGGPYRPSMAARMLPIFASRRSDGANTVGLSMELNRLAIASGPLGFCYLGHAGSLSLSLSLSLLWHVIAAYAADADQSIGGLGPNGSLGSTMSPGKYA